VNKFRHEALLYAGDDDFLAATVPFVADAVAAGEPTMVALPHPRLERLRAQLDGSEEDAVTLWDMEVMGANPARIIPAWEDFVAAHSGAGTRLRGIGEPIWAGRGAAELAECQLHETLLNLAFDDGPPFWLICPYDTEALDGAVISEARCSHPVVSAEPSDRFHAVDGGSVLDAPLPEPERPAVEIAFDVDGLAALRRAVRAEASGLRPEKLEGLLVAVSEAATNSVRHAGGHGTLRMWEQDGALVCEVRDNGRISDPLAGRRRPPADQLGGGWGLWLANALCDLVQLRTSSGGTVVRLHARLG
jgi:anti-sigma regulatory factor (Ser/Thr protein kinase)